MKLQGKRIAYLVEDGFEDLEFWVPVMRLREEGATVVIVGSRLDRFHGKYRLEATADVEASEVCAEEFDGLVVPGGWAPDKLRRYPSILKLVRDVNEQGKIIGAICHAGSVLISAKVVKGRKATGSPGIRDDLLNAGAEWVDVAAIRDANLVWGRVVEDIPAFCRELVNALSEG
jgi:protease I